MNTGWENEQLSAYVDGQLDAAEEAQIEQLLEQSPEARQTVEQIRRLRRLMSDMPRIEVGEDIATAAIAEAERQILSSETKPTPASRTTETDRSEPTGASSPVASDRTDGSPSVLKRLITRRGLAWACLIIGVAVSIQLFDFTQEPEFDPLARVEEQEPAVDQPAEVTTEPAVAAPASNVTVSDPTINLNGAAVTAPPTDNVRTHETIKAPELPSPLATSMAAPAEPAPSAPAAVDNRVANEELDRTRTNSISKNGGSELLEQAVDGTEPKDLYAPKGVDSAARDKGNTPGIGGGGGYRYTNPADMEKSSHAMKTRGGTEPERELNEAGRFDAADDGFSPYGIQGIFPPMSGGQRGVKPDDIDRSDGSLEMRRSGMPARRASSAGSTPSSASDDSTAGRAISPARPMIENGPSDTMADSPGMPLSAGGIRPAAAPANDDMPAIAMDAVVPEPVEPTAPPVEAPPVAALSEPVIEAAPPTSTAPAPDTMQSNPYSLGPGGPATPVAPAATPRPESVAPIVNRPTEIAPAVAVPETPAVEPLVEEPASEEPVLSSSVDSAANAYLPGQGGQGLGGTLPKPAYDHSGVADAPAMPAEPSAPAVPMVPSIAADPAAVDAPVDSPNAPTPSTITFGGGAPGPGSTLQVAPGEAAPRSAAAEALNERLKYYRQEIEAAAPTSDLVLYFDTNDPAAARRAIEAIFTATGVTGQPIVARETTGADGAAATAPAMFVVEASDQRIETMLQMITTRGQLFQKITPARPDQSQQQLMKKKDAAPASPAQAQPKPRQVLFVIRPTVPQ